MLLGPGVGLPMQSNYNLNIGVLYMMPHLLSRNLPAWFTILFNKDMHGGETMGEGSNKT